MTIQLNGSPHTLDTSCTVEALLDSLGMKGRPVVVELNKKALSPSEFASAQVRDGDVVEIISIVAGG